MALSFDATSNSGYQAASASYSWTHTVGTGNNQILVVSVGLLSVTNSVTALTYNGVNLTKLRSDVSVSTTIRTEIWYLVAPTVGAHSVAVTLNTASVSGASATSYNDVDQTNPVDAQNGGAGTTGAGGGSASISTTTVKAGAWLVDAVTTPTTFTVGSGQTQRANINGAVGSMGQSDKGPISPAGATTMQWDNIAALTSWTMSTLSLTPMITPNVSDTTVASESLSYYSDSVDTNERLLFLVTNFINVSDTAATNEFQNISALGVKDTTVTSENTQISIDSFINVSDTTPTSEFVNICWLGVTDTTVISENAVVSFDLSINRFDTIPTGEFINPLIPEFYINSSDSSGTSEFSQVWVDIPYISDQIIANESVQTQLDLNITFISDTTITVESISINSIPLLTFDQLQTQEFIDVLVGGNRTVSDSDIIVTSENISHYSDSVDTNEFIQLYPYFPAIAFDTVMANEFVTNVLEFLAIALTGRPILDQNGNVLLDQNNNPILDGDPGDTLQMVESMKVFRSRGVGVSYIESVYIPMVVP